MRNSNEKEWKLVETAKYGKEGELQHLLAESPRLISISEIRDNASPLVVAVREFPLPIGYIDVLAFSAGGDIAVIECKLASNSDAKRKVIGQVLEYGANLWQISYQELDQAVQSKLGESLAQQVAKETDSSDWDEEDFRRNIESSLQSGNFILIIVVDEINDELSRIVRYMNLGGSEGFDFAALEMRRFQNDNAEMLIPRFFGPAHSLKKTFSADNIQWDEVSFFAELQRRNGYDEIAVSRRILEWAKSNTQIWWGKGKKSGSFVPYLTNDKGSHTLFAVYTYGSVEIYFQWYQYQPPFDTEEKRLEVLQKLNKIEGINISREAVARRPSIRLKDLGNGNRLDQFLAVFDWMIEEIKRI